MIFHYVQHNKITVSSQLGSLNKIMNIDSYIEKIKKYVAKANIEKALKEYENLFQYISSMELEEIREELETHEHYYLLLSGRYYELKNELYAGTILPNEVSQKKCIIRDNLLSLSLEINDILNELNTNSIISTKIPFTNLCAIAGNGEEHLESISINDINNWIIVENAKNHIAMRVKGDSMQPNYYENDIVVCKKVKHNDIKDGKVYVIDIKNVGTLLKRVYINHKEKHYALKSDNHRKYKLQKVKEEDSSFWLVVKKISVAN